MTEKHRTPNLFRWASSELSQDAVLCWLLEWSDPAFADVNPALHRTGRELLRSIFSLCERPTPAASCSVNLKKQVSGLDVLALVGDEYAILLEDKTETREHSDQLERYAREIEKMYPDRQQLRVYCKTGEQDGYEAVHAAGYVVLSRSALLDVLRFGQAAGVSHDLFDEYLAYLTHLDGQYAAFRTAPVSVWTSLWYPWQGFYVWLQKELSDGHWSYVANPSGGFMGYWWHFREAGSDSVYLQLEHEKLCFKIEVGDAAHQSSRRERWYRHLSKVAGDGDLSIEKPRRFGNGQWMTVASLPGDYRGITNQDVVDLDATVATLRKAERLLDRAVQSFGG